MNELLLTLTCVLAVVLAYGTVFYVFERRMHRVYRDGYRELQESYDRSDVIFREAMESWGKSIQTNRELIQQNRELLHDRCSLFDAAAVWQVTAAGRAAGTEEHQP